MVSDKNKPTKAADSPTGVIPQYTQEELRRYTQAKESPQPPETLPEIEPDDAITGQFNNPFYAEGKDSAKEADDNPTGSASQA